MPRKTSATLPSLELKQFVSADEIHRAIAKLTRRIEDLKQLNPTLVRHNDQKVSSLESRIQNTILEIYGLNSPEYREHQNHEIWTGHLQMGMSDHDFQVGFVRGLPQSISMLEGLIEDLTEKLEDFALDAPARAYDAFQGLQLHPRIEEVASKLFKDSHYSEAIFEASKALVQLVRERSGSKLDGAALMDTVFSKNRPILAFNELKDKTDLDEQEGMMYLYKGFVLGIRNPKAHSNVVKKPSEHRALEYLAFISLLAERLNEATLMPQNIQ